MDSDGETVYRVPQFNMVAHGVAEPGHDGEGVDHGQITQWVKALFISGLFKLNHCLLILAKCYIL